MKLTEAQRAEQEKYEFLYTNRNYAHSICHAEPIYDRIATLPMDSIVDVGCGNGLMVQWLLKNRKLSRLAAVDWAANFEMPSGIEFHRAAAHDLPFDDDSFDYLTAFDMLEHLLPSDVEPAFREFRRVAKIGFVFSICTRASIDWNINGQKTQLHPTVQPKEWWRDQIETICQADVEFWPGGTEGFFHGILR